MNKLQLASEQLKLLKIAHTAIFNNAEAQYVGKQCILNSSYFDSIDNSTNEDVIYICNRNGSVLKTKEPLYITEVRVNWKNGLTVSVVYNNQTHFIDVEHIDLV